MFTLIGLGTGVAYGYSVVATIAPQIFPESLRAMGGYPDVYFEAAAAITTLVLLGQVMELRARSRTNAAIRALLDLSPKTARLLATVATGGELRKGHSARTGKAGRPPARASRRKGSGRWRAARRPQRRRRIDDHRRIDSGREIAQQHGHRRDHQHHRLVRDARRARGLRKLCWRKSFRWSARRSAAALPFSASPIALPPGSCRQW